MEIIDFAALRKGAGFTQAQVAEALNLSQSQVSRYEADPSEASLKIAKQWSELCGNVRNTRGIALEGESKRKKINEALDSIYGWFKFAPPTDGLVDLPDLSQMELSIKRMARKPRIAVAGKYDSGKSTLLNYLLGGRHLPTAYQPTTSLVCHIRHIDDKPSWQTEPVWIMKEGYNLDDPDNKSNAEANKLFAGGYDTLKTYAQHQDRIASEDQPVIPIENAVAAVVYLNSSVLTAADFIDMPGYANNKSDAEKAGLASGIFDSLIYTSTTNGFLDSADMMYLRVLLDKLPPIKLSVEANPLSNLFILCTQVHSISDDVDGKSREHVLNNLLDTATQRASHELVGAMEDATVRWETAITQDVLRRRVFGFSVDDVSASIAEKFTDDLKHFLQKTAPQCSVSNLKQLLVSGKEKHVAALSALAIYLEQSINNRAKAQAEFDEVLAKKEESKAHFSNESKRLSSIIDEFLDTTKIVVTDVYKRYINVDYVEQFIRDNYKEKKVAEKYIGGFLIDKIQRDINRKVSLFSERLNSELSGVLGKMSNYLSPVGSVTPFDAQTAFLSALTGAGAAGALAGWAAVVAGSSNLGGYILAAKITGWLAAMGISVGGSTAVMTAIAALGGPVTIAIGLGALAAGLVYAFFGDDWQKRMAKKTVDQFNKEGVEAQISVSLQKYWKDTRTALNHSMVQTLKSYDEYLEDRKKILNMSAEDLNSQVTAVKNVEGFLRSMPMLPDNI
jgi:transcriptional regulator with XRE-family HTH domain